MQSLSALLIDTGMFCDIPQEMYVKISVAQGIGNTCTIHDLMAYWIIAVTSSTKVLALCHTITSF